MRTTHSGALASHETGAFASHKPTSAVQQKRYWREHEPDSVNGLDIGVSEIIDTDVVD